ncbi:P-loop containing nucleoside triphosphate hydrolase protein [Sporormia fimetaria CBS 119925]|uniref:P-loop containing nucleoside triphosphate hydrolase protein n=1 Tax=Sporormia fimetaria CBS 119925 TaxID=1340428 RepID=A0A6A6V4V3_9PLEO|nr:P-loop containing nucleoside triphosphate hydrolase protein [Sporormia fimetaria CBS 119925]
MVRKAKDSASGTAGAAVEQHPGGGHITVTAQQSRYALDAIDAPASKEILIKDLTISVANRDLLSHALLHLVESRHYVLVGRNGTGKSTLLRAIAEGLIPGIPWSTRILLLGQVGETAGLIESGAGAESAESAALEVSEMGRLKVGEETVLQHVLRSDRMREKLVREAAVLEAAVENSRDAMAAVRAARLVRYNRLTEQLKEAHRIAERRSGARGKLARKELMKMEERVEEAKASLQQNEIEIDPANLAEETQAASEMLASVQASLQMMEAHQADAKARKILLGLGFKEDRIEKPMSELSGGWKTRCELACALTQYADVLLLDEPTNFLDLPSIIWLQDYIQSLKHTTVLITTHDRDFGDAVAEELILLREQKLERFRGNLSLWERERYKKIRYLTKMKDAQDKQKKHMEKTVQNNIKAAREKGDDKKLKQAASRKKKLDERMGMEVGLKGGRFKLNRDLGGYHLSNRAEIEVPEFDPPVKISLPSSPPDLRFPGALVSLEKVTFAYPGTLQRVPVLSDIDLTIHPGTRVGLTGLNGSGKSTLVSIITGTAEPTRGTITRHARAQLGCFSQQSVEELTALGAQRPTLTALSHFLEEAGDAASEKDARTALASVGLQGPVVSDVPLALLSGGQKVRLALAKLLRTPPQLLILDEATTHLDADTILGLILALRDYEGALLVVTHDRFFMRSVVEGDSPYRSAPAFRDSNDSEDSDTDEDSVPKGVVYRMVKGQLKKLEGGMEQYETIASRAAKKLGGT